MALTASSPVLPRALNQGAKAMTTDSVFSAHPRARLQEARQDVLEYVNELSAESRRDSMRFLMGEMIAWTVEVIRIDFPDRDPQLAKLK